MMLYDYFLQPFTEYAFMRRALVACFAIAISGAPLGVFLVLRRMSLVGDAISHAILPGASIAFLFYGLSVVAMTAGGLIAGLVIALVAGALTRFTQLEEDASFTATYLLSLASGVLLISIKGSTIDLIHVLFGNVLAVDSTSLLLVCAIATVSTLCLAMVYRVLVVQCFDPDYLQIMRSSKGAMVQQLFLVLVVINLVAAFQALGTLMALGLIVIPAIAGRFWVREMDGIIALSIAMSGVSSYVGLLLSYHYNMPSGPAIVLTAGVIYSLSVMFGRFGSFLTHLPRRHYAR